MNTSVLRAVLTRNFVAYFANPTGYVFIFLFVLLSSIAAFWPHEFFNANLANLDQLNYWFPFIMLVFIPAITMGIWAEERRQGTDELLLTVPAGDFDIVLGKYLAAVAIFSFSLLFSLVTNLVVLALLGSPDVGLFLGIYVGYWLIGLAMLAIGMVASFLTGNLTVAFVLGAVLNLPLVFLALSDTILPAGAARTVAKASVGEQFADFGRGLITLSSTAYFVTVMVAMLYLSMVLIARRHWVRGTNWIAMASHYGLRTLALIVVGVSLTVLFHYHDLRGDVTSEKLNSLSVYTEDLLAQIKKDYKDGKIKHPVQIEAFISPDVPDLDVEQKANLETVLREFDQRGGKMIRVRINKTQRRTEMAVLAKDNYGITSRQRPANERDTYATKEVFMGVAFSCGTNTEILPFIDRGIPAEYELVRSLWTVTRQKRLKIGVLQTDAPLFGTFNMQTGAPGRDWPVITELKKQYDVIRVNPSQPIPVKIPGEKRKAGSDDEEDEDETFDVLLAVQPSAMGEAEVKNFLDAVRAGQPTAVFEDPCPELAGRVPATSSPRLPPPQMMMMMQQQRPLPKGDIKPLWRMLGVKFSGDDGAPGMGFGIPDEKQADRIVWQSYNPYPNLEWFDKQREFVFVDAGCGAEQPFNQEHDVSSGLQQLLFPFPGWIRKLEASKMKVVRLVNTGNDTGIVPLAELRQRPSFFGPPPEPEREPTGIEYVLAAHITGRPKAEPSPHGPPEEKQPDPGDVNVVLVADIDMLTPAFFAIREQGNNPELQVNFKFDNVPFVLNVVDFLAGEQRFLALRKRRPKHRTLTRVREVTEEHRKETIKERREFEEKCRTDIKEEDAKEKKRLDKYRDELEDLRRKAQQSGDPDAAKAFLARRTEIQQEWDIAKEESEQRMDALRKDRETQRDDDIERSESGLAADILTVQFRYKLCSVLLPPIFPLVVALGVWITRRVRESEGVSRDRLR